MHDDDTADTLDLPDSGLPLTVADRVLLWLRDGVLIPWEGAPLSPEAKEVARQRR